MNAIAAMPSLEEKSPAVLPKPSTAALSAVHQGSKQSLPSPLVALAHAHAEALGYVDAAAAMVSMEATNFKGGPGFIIATRVEVVGTIQYRVWEIYAPTLLTASISHSVEMWRVARDEAVVYLTPRLPGDLSLTLDTPFALCRLMPTYEELYAARAMGDTVVPNLLPAMLRHCAEVLNVRAKTD